MKKSTVTVIEIMGISVIFIAFALFFLYGGDYLGLDPSLTANFISLSPYLGLFGIGMVVVFFVRGLMQLPICIFLGVVLALLMNELNVMGLITYEMLSGLTIVQIQLWIIVISSMMGAILFALTKER